MSDRLSRAGVFRALSFLFISIFILNVMPSSAIVAQESGIQLPVEFFFGRWAPGLTVGGEASVSEQFPPLWTVGGTYATDRYRIGISGQTGRAERYTPNGHTDRISGSFQFRPNNRWQLAVEQFSIERIDWNSGPGSRYEKEDVSLVLASRMSRTHTIALTPLLAQYVYEGGRAVGPGELLWNASTSYGRYSFKLDSPDQFLARSRSISNEYTPISTDVVVGLSSRLVIDASLSVRISRWTEEIVYKPFPNSAADIERKDHFDRPSLNLGGLVQLGKNHTVRLTLSQQFASAWEKGAGVIINGTDSTIEIIPYEDHQPLRNERTHFGMELSRFSRGAFDPQIILDDYLGYYKKMLFPRQQLVKIGFYYEALPNDYIYNTRAASIYFDYALGLGGGFEAAAYLSYVWEKNWTRLVYQVFGHASREELTGSVRLRYRSYDYHPGAGPGWGRDADVDIAFGPLLQARQVYLSLLYIPPPQVAIREGTVAGFLSLSGFESNHTNQFVLDWEIGLGGGAAAFGRTELMLRYMSSNPEHKWRNDWDVQFGLRKRMCRSFEVRAHAARMYRTGPDDPPQFNFSAAGLFW